MNKRVKKLWVAALTSGKYEQDRGQLKSDKGHCCLGVLTDLYRKEKKKGVAAFWGKKVEETKSVPPKEVCKWAGLSNPNPTLMGFVSLVELNDIYKYNFSQLSKLISKHL